MQPKNLLYVVLAAGALGACGDGEKEQSVTLVEYQDQQGVASPIAEQYARLCDLSRSMVKKDVRTWLHQLIKEGRVHTEKDASKTPPVNLLTFPEVGITVTFNEDELSLQDKTVKAATLGNEGGVRSRIFNAFGDTMQIKNEQWKHEAAPDQRLSKQLKCDVDGTKMVIFPPEKTATGPAS